MSLPRSAIEAALGEALGEAVTIERSQSLAGGCINAAARLETSAGPFFVKHAEAEDARFSVEARQLEALTESPTSLVVPRPLAWRDGERGAPGFLVTTFLEPGARGAGFDEALGRGLAELHRASAEAFGFSIDTFCGSTPQPNPWTESWVDFYREHRLRHQLRLLTDQGKIGGADADAFERLLGRLDELLDATEPPSLVHGDLWSGNLLASAGGPALVDPAAYYAHREAELGMTTLMGGFSERVYAAYEEAWPLPAGWRARNPLYELWHLANHATLFGGSYVGSTLAVVRRFA